MRVPLILRTKFAMKAEFVMMVVWRPRAQSSSASSVQQLPDSIMTVSPGWTQRAARSAMRRLFS